MEDNLSDLIVTLTKLVEKLDDKSTGEVTSKTRYNPDDMFAPSEEQVSAKENKQLAKDIAKENSKNTKEKKQSRKITKDLTPVSVMDFDNKALKQLGSVISNNITSKIAKEKKEPEVDTPGWLGALKMLGYGAFALIVGPIITLVSMFEEIGKQGWFKSLKSFLKTKVGARLSKWFKPIITFFEGLRTKLSDAWKSIKKGFKPVSDFFKKIGNTIKRIFKPVTDFATKVGTKLKTVKDAIMSFVKPFFGGATKPGIFTRLMNIIMNNPVIKGMTAFFKGLGSMLGKIFLPITIIMGVFDFVTGFMDGYEKEGSIIDGIEAGITKVFDTLIALPLDLLKDGVSWILEKMGFEGASETLDSFSFSEIFAKMFDSIFGYYKKLVEKVTKIFTGLYDSFMAIFESESEGEEKSVGEKILGFVSKLYMLPYDLIKSAVSAIAGAFGFENVEKTLDSWSFSDLYEDLIGGIFGFMSGAIDFIKLLFTEPEKAFKKIGDWFDKLFADPVKTIKEMLPQWMLDFGGWLYDNSIGPIVQLFKDITMSPTQSKAAFKKLLPEWMSGFADWVFDEFILPISEYFTKLFEATSASEILSALIPQWLKNTGQWVYDNTIQPLMDLFDVIGADPKGAEAAFLEMLPEWMTGIGKWIFKNLVKPIADWFNKARDPETEFMELIPDWMKDVSKWIYNTLIKPISDMITQLLDIDFAGIVKAKMKDTLPTAAYEFIYGTPEEEAAAATATAKKAATKATADVTGLSETAQKTVDAARSKIEKTTGGSVTGDRTTAIMDALDEAMEEGHGEFKKTRKTLIEQLGGKNAYDSLIKTSGKSEKDFINNLASGYEKTMGFDGTSAKGDKWIEEVGGNLAMTVANQEDQQRSLAIMVNAYAEALKSEGLKLSGTQYMWAQLADKESITSEMLKSYNNMVGNLDLETQAGQAMAQALENVGISRAMKSTAPLDNAPVEMNDFIWRPGQKPMTFSKGDILIGSHEDNVSPTTTGDDSGKHMINRMDRMVEIMTEHSSIHTKVLEVLTESGLIDKQGNTVVNNGGNTSVVNNTVSEPGIMDFRDRVVGRLSR